MSNELKPCPFCGGKAALHMSWMGDGHRYSAVECVECGATTPGNYSEVGDQSVWDWNVRTPEQAIAATLGGVNPDGLPNGLTISDDGALLNWRGENYVKQSTLGSEREKALEKLVQKALDECWCDEWWYEDARKLGMEANY